MAAGAQDHLDVVLGVGAAAGRGLGEDIAAGRRRWRVGDLDVEVVDHGIAGVARRRAAKTMATFSGSLLLTLKEYVAWPPEVLRVAGMSP